MGYIDARDLLMEVSQDYSWPEMYLVDVHEFPILFGMSCFVFSAEMKWLLTPSLSRAINDGQSVQAWYLRVDIHSKCWRGAPFTWIGFPFVSHGNHQRDTVSLRVLFWQLPPQEARRRQNEEPLFFFLGGAMRKTRGILVPKLNGRSSRQPVTIGCQHGRGDYMGRSWAQTWIPSWYIYIYVYLLDKHFHVLLPEVLCFHFLLCVQNPYNSKQSRNAAPNICPVKHPGAARVSDEKKCFLMSLIHSKLVCSNPELHAGKLTWQWTTWQWTTWQRTTKHFELPSLKLT